MTSLSTRLRYLPLLVAMAGGFFATGCAWDPTRESATTPLRTYVLVHGAFENQAIWGAVRQGLEQAGQRVITVDLPGRDGDATPADQLTLDLYRDTLEKCIASLGAPAILVGHSFGGITISNVAEQHPEQVSTLVFLAALLPRDGDSALALSRADKTNAIAPGSLVVSPDHQWGSLLPGDPQAQQALFCADCTPEQAARFKGSLMPEPIAPLRTQVHLSAERYGRVDKVYIATDDDRIVSPQAQRDMLAATPTRQVVHLASSHSPFLSQPATLVRLLLAIDR